MKYKFDTIFHIKAAQNMVAEHFMNTILTWFSTSRQQYEKYFDMIFHLKASSGSTLAEHEERDFELIFQFKTPQNVVRRHFERDFDMNIHLKLEAAQNLVRQQHEWDFHMISHFKKSRKISCRQHYEGNFDMNFLFIAPQIWIAEH